MADMRRRPRAEDLSGRRFGKLVVIRRMPDSPRYAKWLCRCDCGKNKIIRGTALRKTLKPTASCGCLQAANHRTHGATKTPTYRVWSAMKNRCLNLNHRWHHAYGGRGIAVCERWLKFENFLEDMGAKPARLSLERIDNNRGYEPDNCRWATQKEQMNNRRNTLFLTFNGKTQSVTQWAQEIGISRQALFKRIYAGWTSEKALTAEIDEVKSIAGSLKTI